MRRRPNPIAPVEKLITREDRVVSWARAGEDVVVATRLGLWWPSDSGHRMIGWQLISKAVWDAGSLTVIEAEVVGELFLVDRAPVTVALTETRDLPPTVRKRVELSVAQSELITLPDGSGRFVGRRVPGQDGLTWWCRLEPGTADDDRTRAAVQEIIEAIAARSAAAIA
jgi:hypothetical protein